MSACIAPCTAYISGMLIFTCEGLRSVDDGNVLHTYRGNRQGNYVEATLVMANGEELSGRVLAAVIECA